MSESDSIDLSELQSLQFGPTWAEQLAKSEAAPGEVVWGRFEERPQRGGDRGPRRDGRSGGGRDARGPGRGDGGRGFERRGDNRGPRPEYRGGPGGERRDGPPPRREGGPPPRGDRRDGPRPAGGGDQRGPRPDRGERRDGPPRGDRERGGDRRDFKGRGPGREGGRFDRRDDRRDGPPAPLAGWQAKLLPEPRSVEAIARQIKASGRAFSVFDVGRLFMTSRDRYLVQFSRAKAQPPQNQKQGQPPAPPAPPRGPEVIFQCAADQSLWLARDEAIRHILHSPAIEKYYRRETVAVDAPKGNWSTVAVCGFSGALLGPPNHHDFQRNVARIHRERFSDMTLERYKSRIRTEKDEALLAKWQENQSTTVQFVPVTSEPLPEGTEAPAPLKSQAEMEAHFLRTHAPDAVKEVNTATVPGGIHMKCLAAPIFSLLRREVEQQQRFPMGLVQDLCRELEGRGLRFFKRDKKATFVVRTRPHFLPDDLVLSDRIRSIVEMVRANPGITYTRLVATLAPHVAVEPSISEAAQAATPAAEVEAHPQPEAAAPAETTPAPEVTEAPAPEVIAFTEEAAPVAEVVPSEETAATVESAAGEEATPPAAEDPPPAAAEPAPLAAPEAPAGPILSPEEIAILQDLRWLVNEGYVTEFAEGELYVLGRPPQPVPEKKEKPARQKPAAPSESSAEAPAAKAAPAAADSTPAEAESGPAEPAPPAEEPATPAPEAAVPTEAPAAQE